MFTYKDLTPHYDPSIQSLVDNSDDQWGNPLVNRENLVPFGIKPFDRALYGMDTTNGELNLIIGPQKQRKTTMAINILVNYMTADKPKVKPFTVIDTLESGMRPEKYKDTLLSVVATRLLIEEGHAPKGACRLCGGRDCEEMGINPDFLRYNTRSTTQKEAIDHARSIVRQWPMLIYGASLNQGDTRNLENALQQNKSRWQRLIEEAGAEIFILDHVQQYHIKGVTHASDYEKQIQAIAAVGDVVSQYNIVCLMLSQISMTSQREKRSGAGNLTASGGTKAHQEANVIFSASYQDGAGYMKMTIEESRDSGNFSVYQDLEDVSGAFYGNARYSFENDETNAQKNLIKSWE